MIGYLRFRRESLAAYEDPSLRVWLIGTRYQLRARLLHRLGRHTWRRAYPDGDVMDVCTWCGHRRVLYRQPHA